MLRHENISHGSFFQNGDASIQFFDGFNNATQGVLNGQYMVPHPRQFIHKLLYVFGLVSIFSIKAKPNNIFIFQYRMVVFPCLVSQHLIVLPPTASSNSKHLTRLYFYQSHVPFYLATYEPLQERHERIVILASLVSFSTLGSLSLI